LEKIGKEKKLDRAPEILELFEQEVRSLMEAVRRDARGNSAQAG
jgi:hypothetical protein